MEGRQCDLRMCVSKQLLARHLYIINIICIGLEAFHLTSDSHKNVLVQFFNTKGTTGIILSLNIFSTKFPIASGGHLKLWLSQSYGINCLHNVSSLNLYIVYTEHTLVINVDIPVNKFKIT